MFQPLLITEENMEKILFKVWSADNIKKSVIIVDDNDNIYENLTEKASEKLNIVGCSLVLQSDGTVVDDGDALKLLNKETFVLLEKNSSWQFNPINTTKSDDTIPCQTHSFLI